MLAFHVSSRASGQRSWKKHSSSSLELVLGVMKHFRLILFVCVLYDVDYTLVDSCGRLYTCRAHVVDCTLVELLSNCKLDADHIVRMLYDVVDCFLLLLEVLCQFSVLVY